MKKINAVLSFFILLNALCFSIQTSAQEINAAKLDSFFNVLAANNKAMGSFMIAHNGKPIYKKTIGYSLIEGSNKIPATPATQYRIGSITKTFTATMIFQLIDEKKLSLDTKLSKFFPEIPNSDRITIANLLNHTSGLADPVNENLTWIVEPHTKAELLEKITSVKPHFEPGAKQQYSNGGYLLLGYIVEKITGKTFVSALNARILNKLGLRETIAGTLNSSQKLEARPYKYIADWTPVKDLYFPNVPGVGDILSTPKDLNVFINALFSGKLVSAEGLANMRKFEGKNMLGMGLLRLPYYDKTVIGHNGGTLGTYSAMYAIPEDGMSFAFSINGLNYNMNDITLALLGTYYHNPYQMPLLNSITLKTEELDGLLGNYSSADLPLKISITKSGAILMGQGSGQPSFTLEAVTKDEFRNGAIGVVLQFNREKQEMTLIQGGRNFHYLMDK